MGFFDALGKIGKGVMGTALLPVDAVKDTVSALGFTEEDESALAKRARKIAKNVAEGIDEIDEE